MLLSLISSYHFSPFQALNLFNFPFLCVLVTRDVLDKLLLVRDLCSNQTSTYCFTCLSLFYHKKLVRVHIILTFLGPNLLRMCALVRSSRRMRIQPLLFFLPNYPGLHFAFWTVICSNTLQKRVRRHAFLASCKPKLAACSYTLMQVRVREHWSSHPI